MTTVHMIGNAHLDPVWLWRKTAGIGEALLTCRSIVDRLEEFPDFIFTRSDVWVYEQIQDLDPELFARIQDLVRAGRWSVVGGWYIQPDCNLPTGASFEKHIEIGQKHHLNYFDARATVGYNVDSFGHSAGLPSILKRNGYDSYVFMRPGPHEKDLPGSLFRWRSPDGSEVTAWRIHDRYNVDTVELLKSHIPELVDRCSTDGIDHVMCFFGVGDHGGGPTKSLLEWISANRNYFPDCTIEFSSPRRFFDAVKPHVDRLPVVQDELNYHAVGCYSVVHASKADVRRAEHLAFMAQRTIDTYPDFAAPNAHERIDAAWRHILFNQFHDIFDGTSEPDSYIETRDEVGAAAAELTKLLLSTMFRRFVALPPSSKQRVIAYNPASVPFSGIVTHEPWLDWAPFSGALVAEDGSHIPYQIIQQASRSGSKRRLLWEAKIPASGETHWYLDHDTKPAQVDSTDLESSGNQISNSSWTVLSGKDGTLFLLFPDGSIDPIRLSIDLIDDDSDTWSHFVPGYAKQPREHFMASKVVIEERGPLRTSIRIDASGGASTLSIWVRLYRNSPVLDVHAAVTWMEHMTISKLSLSFPEQVTSRSDSVPGAILERTQNGEEYPILDTTELRLESGSQCRISSPDSYGLDGTRNVVRYTLLRSPAFAWQGKKGTIDPTEYQRWTDRGEHVFRFSIVHNSTNVDIQQIAESTHEPPIVFDWTVGMEAERGSLRRSGDGGWHDPSISGESRRA